jgi:hypothetical protein
MIMRKGRVGYDAGVCANTTGIHSSPARMTQLFDLIDIFKWGQDRIAALRMMRPAPLNDRRALSHRDSANAKIAARN